MNPYSTRQDPVIVTFEDSLNENFPDFITNTTGQINMQVC